MTKTIDGIEICLVMNSLKEGVEFTLRACKVLANILVEKILLTFLAIISAVPSI